MTERFEMRLDQETLDSVDEWRGRQRDLPSRAEAIRRLIESGLLPEPKPQIRLSDGEKLILFMLCDLYKHLKVKGEIDPNFVAEALIGGHYWGLKWRYPGIFHGHEDSEHVVSEVVDILDMWSFLERGYNELSQEDRARVEAEAAPFGKDVRFRGFDGNNETDHLSIARFLVGQLERFAVFDGRDLNSHMPSVDSSRRMLRVFLPMRQNLMGRELGLAEIIAILNEMTHPEPRRKAVT